MRSIAGALIALGVVLAAALLEVGGEARVATIPWFVPLVHGFLVLVAACVALLAFGRYRVLRDVGSFWAAIAFSGFAVAMLFNVLTFSGVLPGAQSVIGSLANTSAWEGALALQCVALSLLVGALARWPRGTARTGRSFGALIAWILAVTAISVASVVYEEHLPVLVRADGSITNLVFAITGAVLGIEAALGIALSTRRYVREGDALFVYLALCQVALLGVALLTIVAMKRFDVWWIMQRAIWVAGFLAVLFGLLSEYLRLFERGQEKIDALRASEARLRAFYESGALGVIYWSMSGEITDANDRFLEMVGYTREELNAGKLDWRQLTPAEYRATDERSNARLKATGLNSVPYEKEYIRKDGTRVPVFVGGVMLDETRANGLAIVLDITERKRVEEALRSANEALREADRSKDEFLAMLSHELRNPLATISNAMAVIERMNVQEPMLRRLHEMTRRQGQHLARLVDDLLDVSRITRGKIAILKTLVPLDEVVERAVDMARPIVEARMHRFTVEMPQEPLVVEGDEARLVQVLGNLLDNAAKYTDPGGHVELAVSREGNRAVVRVSDSGSGIEPELLPKVFELFRQGDRALDRAQGGLGIGLTLAKRIVDMHGGSLAAASAGPERGSTFELRLPLAAQAAAAAESARPLAVAAKPRRLLVVDDSRDAADSLALLLRSAGYEVTTAYNGQQALELAADRFDAVLLDLGMPGMDGCQVARALKSRGNAPTLVAVTGYGNPEERQRAAQAGFDYHLLKPVEYADLEDVLSSIEGETSRDRLEPHAGAL